MEWEVATRWENDKRDQRKLSLPKKFIIKSLYHYTVYNQINSILSKDKNTWQYVKSRRVVINIKNNSNSKETEAAAAACNQSKKVFNADIIDYEFELKTHTRRLRNPKI